MSLYSKIIFVCENNVCRSPSAEAVMKHISRISGLEIASRGLVVLFPEPYNPKIRSLLLNDGIILGNGTTKQLQAEDFGEDTLIVTMDRVEKQKIIDEYDNCRNVYTIMEFAGGSGDIMDPYGADMDVYALFYESIKLWVKQLEDKLFYLSIKERTGMISIGSDHGGYDLKQAVIKHLQEKGMEVKDFGCFNKESCDYPEFGRMAAKAVANGECGCGIVICTTGIGISITANKVKGIRCALCTSAEQAELTRLHNNANMLALGASTVSEETALKIVDKFMETDFSNEERHQRRIDKIEG